MFSELESRSLKGVYLDSFVAGANKGSMPSSFRVNKILSYSSSSGIVFKRHMASTKLRTCFDNFVHTKKGIISRIVEENTTPMKVYWWNDWKVYLTMKLNRTWKPFLKFINNSRTNCLIRSAEIHHVAWLKTSGKSLIRGFELFLKLQGFETTVHIHGLGIRLKRTTRKGFV